MLTFLRQRATPLTLLICLAFIAMKMSGAHVHRHVDVAQGAQVLHVGVEMFHGGHADHHEHSAHADDGFHPEHAAESATHEDIEAASIAISFEKLFKLDLTSLVLLAAVAFRLFTPQRVGPVSYCSPPRKPLARTYLRPPLRGPPPFSIA
jgi:hypothetical protein